jgi:predicted transcriptional regulator
MKNEEKEKIKNVASYLEDGIVELGKENNLTIEAITVFKEQKGNMPQSVFIIQNFAKKFSEEVELKPSEYRILFHLMSLMEYENNVSIDQNTIAENLGMTRKTVISGLKELESLNIVIKFTHKQDRRRNEYWVNPHTMWKGSSDKRMKIIKTTETKNPSILELPFYDDKRLFN